MTPKENINLEKQFNEFYGELEKYIYLREDRHDIGTIDFVAKSILYFLGFVEVSKFQAEHLLIINNHQHFKFINAQSENLFNNIKNVTIFFIGDIEKTPEFYDPDITFIHKMYWVDGGDEDIAQKVLYDLS